MKHLDKNGNELLVGMEVLAPEPNESDMYNFSFNGTVEDLLENGNAIVMDQDYDCFEIESDRLEINQ